MKVLVLTTRQAGKKTVYEVHENGKLLANRTSDREYFGCMVHEYQPGKFSLPKFFGRKDLMDKFRNDPRNEADTYYGIATIPG